MDGDPLSRIDPLGLDWVYHQGTGQLQHVDSQGNTTNVGQGYAGRGAGLDNSGMQNVPNVGPLPQGTYNIGSEQNNDNGHLRDSMRLMPSPDNQMFGRSGFLIHGPHAHDHLDSSNGCIVLVRPLRDRIGHSGDHVLRVVP